MARGIKHNPRTDYALHEVITGASNSKVAQNKRWWISKLLGPQREKYSRMLFGLPPKQENDE